MPIKASLNTQLLQSAMTDWNGIYMDRAARQIETDRENRRKIEEDAEQKELRDYTYGKLKADQMSKLVVSSESKHQGVQNYLQHMSGQLVDRQSQLIDMYKDDKIDSTQFAAETAKLQAQVPQIKGFVTQLDTGLGIYSTGLAQKSLSKAMSKEDDYLWKAITDGRGEFAMDDNNILVYQGKTENGDDFSFPANKLNQMPMPMLKVDSFAQNTLPIAIELAKPISQELPNGKWVKQSIGLEDPRFKETIRGSFDDFLKKNGGELALRSLAADHAGYTNERINVLLNSGTYEAPDGEEYANQLEYEMEQDWLASAADQYQSYITKQFDGPMYNAETARINALKQQQRGAVGTEKERFKYKNINYLRSLPPPTPQNINTWVEYNPGGWEIGQNEDGGTVIARFNNKGETQGFDIPPEILNNPAELAKFLAKHVYNVGPADYRFNYKK